MKRFLIIITTLLTISNGFSQFDPQAKEIIKPVSDAVLNSPGVSVDFEFTVINKQTEMEDTDSGKLLLSGNKFRLSLLGTETYYDGETQWVHMVDEGEVNISTPDPDGEFELTPWSVFTMYEKGFRFKIVEQDDQNVTIDMFPATEDTPYFKIRLVLDTLNKTFEEVAAFGRDGMNTTIRIVKMKKDVNLNENEFVFKATKYPGIEVIDMR